MKVTFIYHSGYMIELADSILIFDYYKGEIPEFDKNKKVYVFSSHNHADHFNKDIFHIFNDCKNVIYILSSDIHINNMDKHIVFMNPNEQMLLEDNIRIWTFQSTDEGVAFLVKCDEKYIYHAGDLNWWHWDGETEDYNDMMRVNYQKEIDYLKRILLNEQVKLDLSFVVLDERQKEAYDFGMQYFLDTIPSEIVFPMHFFDNGYKVCEWLQNSGNENKEKVVSIDKPQMEFEL